MFAEELRDPGPRVLRCREYDRRYDFENKTTQLITALVGPRPTQARLIRARSAVAVVKAGTVAALELGKGRVSAALRREILAAALGALDS